MTPFWIDSINDIAQWHQMSVITSPIFDNSDFIVQQLNKTNNKEDIKAHWPLVRIIQLPPLDSLHKGPVMQRARPYHDVIMYNSEFNYLSCQVIMLSAIEGRLITILSDLRSSVTFMMLLTWPNLFFSLLSTVPGPSVPGVRPCACQPLEEIWAGCFWVRTKDPHRGSRGGHKPGFSSGQLGFP